MKLTEKNLSGETVYNGKILTLEVDEVELPAGLVTGSILKAVFMGAVVILIILPVFGGNVAGKLPKPEALPKVLATAKVTFSVTQLITALIGSALAYIIWIPLKNNLSKEDFQ